MDSVDNNLLEALRRKIHYDKDIFETTNIYEEVLISLLEDSKYIALSLYAPFDLNIDKLPKRYDNWQVRCAVEIYNNIGTIGLKSYAENGLSWTRDSDYISNGLRDEIQPLVGTISNGGV